MKFLNDVEELDPLPSFGEVSNPVTETTEPTTEVKSEEDSLPEFKVEQTTATTETTTETKQDLGVVKSLLKSLNEELGIWKEEELEQLEDSTETLIEKVKEASYSIADSEVDNYIQNKLEPFNQRLLNLMEEGVSEEKVLQLGKERVFFKDVDKDNLSEDLAEKTYRTYLRKTTKFSEDRINKEIQTKKDLDTLNEEAKEVFDDLQNIFLEEEKAEIKKVQDYQDTVKKQAISRVETINSQIDSLENLGGLKVSEKIKKELKKHFLPVQTDSGVKSYLQAEREKEPMSFDIAMNALSALGVLKYDGRSKKFTLDFSNVSSVGKTKAMEELENAVNKTKVKEQSTTGNSKLLTKQLSEEEQIKLFVERASKLTKK